MLRSLFFASFNFLNTFSQYGEQYLLFLSLRARGGVQMLIQDGARRNDEQRVFAEMVSNEPQEENNPGRGQVRLDDV